MKADQVQSRSRHQRWQSLHELHRLHHMVIGTISPCRFELQHHLPGAVHTQAFIGNCRASEVAAQLFEPLPIIGFATHVCVQVEARRVGAQRPADFVVGSRTARGELQEEHLLARTRAVSDAIGRCRGLQRHRQVIRIGEAACNTIISASSIRCPRRVSNRNIRAMILPSSVCSAAWLGATAGWKMGGDVIASVVPVSFVASRWPSTPSITSACR